MGERIIVPGSVSAELADKLGQASGMLLCDVERKVFPDGEIYVRILSNIEERDAVIVQSTNSNDSLIELFLLIDACRRMKPSKIEVVLPYFGYARQDRIFEKGEAWSSFAIAKIVYSLGAERIISVDPHFCRTDGDHYFGDHKVECFSSAEYMAEKIADKLSLKKPLIIAPDLTAGDMAEAAAKSLSADTKALEKKRNSDTDVEVKGEVAVEGRDVIIFDDIISTGGTMIRAINALKGRAESITAACVHGVFSGDALKKLKEAGARHVIASDSLPNKAEKISLAEFLTGVIE